MASQRILVRGVNWLGDAVMSTPALQRLREAKPSAEITLLTPEHLAGLWKNRPAVDNVMTFRKDEGTLRVARRLREKDFELALVLPNSPRSALEVFLARIPERVGHKRPWRNWFLTRRIQPHPEAVTMRKRTTNEIRRLIQGPPAVFALPAKAHHIHQYLHLAAALGANPEPVPPHIAVAAEEVTAIQHRFKISRDAAGCPPLFGLNAGAAYGPAKRWPRERFIAAAVTLQRRTGCHWWIFGSEAERESAAAMTAEIQKAETGSFGGAQCLAGLTSLRELCAALKACDLLLTNDSGPMHLAAAVGSTVVALFGSTSPELTGPGLHGQTRHFLLKSDTPCAPCFRRECPIDFRCMRDLGVEQVVAAAVAAVG